MDAIDVLRLGESLGSGVASFTCPAVSLGLTELVEMDLGWLSSISRCEQPMVRGSGDWQGGARCCW